MALAHAAAVVADGCPVCGGIWFDEGEMQQLANRPSGLVAVAKLFVPSGEWDCSPRTRACPRCHSGLEPFEFDSLRGIQLDRCGTCRGIYLDHGEAEAIEQRLHGAAT
jgi:Zn-finger nucleic acid-binding protein